MKFRMTATFMSICYKKCPRIRKKNKTKILLRIKGNKEASFLVKPTYRIFVV